MTDFVIRRKSDSRIRIEFDQLRLFTLIIPFFDLFVVIDDVAGVDIGQEFVAPLHFAHRPPKGQRRLLRLGNHRKKQMGNPFVERKFQHLWIDHDDTNLFGSRLVEERDDHRIDRHRFSGAGGPGNQEMRHFGQIGDVGDPFDILPQGKNKFRFIALKFFVDNDILQPHRLADIVGNFDANRRFVGKRRHNTDGAASHGERQVVHQVGNARELDAGGRGEFKHRNNRAGMDFGHMPLNGKIQKFLLQQAGLHFQAFLIHHHLLLGIGIEQ